MLRDSFLLHKPSIQYIHPFDQIYPSIPEILLLSHLSTFFFIFLHSRKGFFPLLFLLQCLFHFYWSLFLSSVHILSKPFTLVTTKNRLRCSYDCYLIRIYIQHSFFILSLHYNVGKYTYSTIYSIYSRKSKTSFLFKNTYFPLLFLGFHNPP